LLSPLLACGYLLQDLAPPLLLRRTDFVGTR
jgi:hypothetical protein